jgi:CDP-glycerol glycerophosphotransferase (TagB/SpsB family)
MVILQAKCVPERVPVSTFHNIPSLQAFGTKSNREIFEIPGGKPSTNQSHTREQVA